MMNTGFNAHYEFYGRKIVPVDTGCGGTAVADREQQRRNHGEPHVADEEDGGEQVAQRGEQLPGPLGGLAGQGQADQERPDGGAGGKGCAQFAWQGNGDILRDIKAAMQQIGAFIGMYTFGWLAPMALASRPTSLGPMASAWMISRRRGLARHPSVGQARDFPRLGRTLQ